MLWFIAPFFSRISNSINQDYGPIPKPRATLISYSPWFCRFVLFVSFAWTLKTRRLLLLFFSSPFAFIVFVIISLCLLPILHFRLHRRQICERWVMWIWYSFCFNNFVLLFFYIIMLVLGNSVFCVGCCFF